MTSPLERSIALIAAPTTLGLRPTGVSELPAALRAAGLLEGVPRVHEAARLDVPPYSSVRDSATGVQNAEAIRRFSVELGAIVGRELSRSRFPLVLGGDCSVLLGIGLGLQGHGRHGLLFIDGHADFYSPDAEPYGELASMDLAAVTGRLPGITTSLAADAMFRDDDVVVFGYRDGEDAAMQGSPDVRETQMLVLDLDAVRRLTVPEASKVALATLERDELRGFWLHLDADVLADEVMPAVDYRMPGGFSMAELETVLEHALASQRMVGMDVTIYNPRLDDAAGSAGTMLARMLNRRLKHAT